ncbi:nitrile hydratase subunit alpha [Natronorubrum sp. JWXQ-INN-674]|uniref:Nitrile hydratase subunit alpha n=1 Tax=Natronorubrum halalkaliphilum TaxID=2691917 RepID=A0A6B0VRL8_9EURY|nr:nitrile hydratase subunit alpha [Natronorubrum halalkaliphilum]MXV63432.1 nitrile hydratase subunit alpha [Natronorubrum halalkaliphilum]
MTDDHERGADREREHSRGGDQESGHGDEHDHDHDDGHGHGHSHDGTYEDPRPRVRAIQSLLVEKGLVSTDAIDEAIAAYERDIGPQNGARVVARAWTDPEFKDRLLEDATAAIEEFDFEVGVQHIEVKENTDDVHNAVVCTLCSCYPWSLLGLPPTWYKTPAYRSRLVREPRAVLEEFGLELDDGLDVDVWDSSSEIRYMVLPNRPEGTEGSDEDELAALVTRDAMIGVERLDARGTDADAGSAADGGVTDPAGAFADLLGVDAEPTFTAPWQARAFGVTVALYDEGSGFDWSAFQRRLIEAVDATPTGAYATNCGRDAEADAGAIERIYSEQWHGALERLLVGHDVLEPDAIDARAVEFVAGERTAEEFVAGNRGH